MSSPNRFQTSPPLQALWPPARLAPTRCCIFREIYLIPGYPGSSRCCSHVKIENVILFRSRNLGLKSESKLRQKQTPGDHKLAGTGPQPGLREPSIASRDHRNNSLWFQTQTSDENRHLVMFRVCGLLFESSLIINALCRYAATFEGPTSSISNSCSSDLQISVS